MTPKPPPLPGDANYAAYAVIPPPELDPFDDVPTKVRPRPCPGCTGPFFEMPADAQQPATHAEAWRRGPLHDGKALYEEGACRGNKRWEWCKAPIQYEGKGALTLPDMRVQFFENRRVGPPREVAVERRGLPPGAPPKR